MNMKKLFSEHFKDEEEIKELWRDCIFVFDTSVMCDLYRYSDSTRSSLFHIMEKLKNRLWIPNRVADEYLRNRAGVITKQEKYYTEAIKAIEALENDLNQKKKHPFISNELHEKFENISGELKGELESNRKKYLSKISKDDIKDKVAEVFGNNVGEPFSYDEINQILIEGEKRFKEKIPPGYMDRSKEKSSENFTEFDERCRVYGDFIVWKQVIDKANDGFNVVLVTSDSKEDWWKIESKKTIGPRHELIREFEKETGKKFYMYQPDRFLEFAQNYLNEKVDENALEEMKEISFNNKSMDDFVKNNFDLLDGEKEGNNKYYSKINNYNVDFERLEMQIDAIKAHLENLERERERLLTLLHSGDSELGFERYDEIVKESENIKYQIQSLKTTESKMQNQKQYMMHKLNRLYEKYL